MQLTILLQLDHEGAAGPDELAIMAVLLIAALVALYLALRMPRLPEYQPPEYRADDRDQAEPR